MTYLNGEDFRSKNSKFLNTDIQNALAIVGYSVIKRNISIIMTILFKQNEKDVLFVNVQRTKKHQLHAVSVLRSFVMNILLNIFFVTLAANKKYHSSNFFTASNMKIAYFLRRVSQSTKKYFMKFILSI